MEWSKLIQITYMGEGPEGVLVTFEGDEEVPNDLGFVVLGNGSVEHTAVDEESFHPTVFLRALDQGMTTNLLDYVAREVGHVHSLGSPFPRHWWLRHVKCLRAEDAPALKGLFAVIGAGQDGSYRHREAFVKILHAYYKSRGRTRTVPLVQNAELYDDDGTYVPTGIQALGDDMLDQWTVVNADVFESLLKVMDTLENAWAPTHSYVGKAMRTATKMLLQELSAMNADLAAEIKGLDRSIPTDSSYIPRALHKAVYRLLRVLEAKLHTKLSLAYNRPMDSLAQKLKEIRLQDRNRPKPSVMAIFSPEFQQFLGAGDVIIQDAYDAICQSCDPHIVSMIGLDYKNQKFLVYVKPAEASGKSLVDELGLGKRLRDTRPVLAAHVAFERGSWQSVDVEAGFLVRSADTHARVAG